jgi:hypothetical protein
LQICIGAFEQVGEELANFVADVLFVARESLVLIH